MRRINGKVLLRDNRDLSPAELQRARTVCQRIDEYVASRNKYIEDGNLDREFSDPAGLWSPTAANDYLNTYREVSSCRYEVINRLRLFVSFFSGYSLRRLSRTPGAPSYETLSMDLDSKIGELLQSPDNWVWRWLTLASEIPERYVISPPKLLGEVGWNVSGVLVNHDTCVYQERINLLYRSGVLNWLRDRLSRQQKLRVLEIGAGYGALGYALNKFFPATDYWICDLPESLLFSSLYLSLTLPGSPAGFGEPAENGFTYMPNYLIDRISGKFDLVINTLSFSEMSEHQLRIYAKTIAGLLEDGILFEQNQDNRPVGFLCAKDILGEYFPAHRPVDGGRTWNLTQGYANLWGNRSTIFPPSVGNRRWHHVQIAALEGRRFLWRIRRHG